MKNIFSIFLLLLFINNKSYAQAASYLSVNDTRYINDLPSFLNHAVRADFKLRTSIGVPGTGVYSTNLTFSPWEDNSGDKNHQLNFNNGGIFFRSAYASDPLWGGWRQLMITDENGNVGIGTSIPSAKLEIFGNAGDATNIILSADYPTSHRWRLKTIDRGNTIDLDFTLSNSLDEQEQVLKLSRSNSGRPQFQLYNNAIVANNGNVGIGTANPLNKLDVKGTIHSQLVKVDMLGWSDFVFKREYTLPTLKEVEKHITEKGHLENIPSEEEVLKAGINLGEMNAKLLQKIEELTLYAIDQNKKIETQEKEISALKDLVLRVEKIESKLIQK